MNDNKLIELLSEEIRETKKLTKAVREETKAIREETKEAKRKADAAWELVVLTRNQMSKPFWKRVFGL
ncbi:MAG: hypothetical protein AAGF85_08110 [Bacteroidota bacterium]